MSTAVSEWALTFGTQAVRLRCDDPPTSALLTRYLGHCFQHATGPPLAEYALTAVSPHTIQLQENQRPVITGDVRRVLPQFMHLALERLITDYTDALVFHAAGLTWQGRGVLACGQTGQGKSTFTAWAVGAGCGYLTDEVVALSPHSLMMTGWPRSLILRGGSAFVWQRWLAPADQVRLQPFTDGTVWVPPAWLGGDVAGQVPVSVLLFPRFESGAALAIRPLSTASAAFLLMQHLVNAQNLAGHGLTAVSWLARQVPAFQVTYGHVETAVTWLQQELEGAA